MPVSKWLKSDLKYLINEYLSREKVERQGIFNYHPIEKLIRDLFLNHSDTSWQIWNLIVFQSWYSRYIDHESLN
jgi:asparagine synthase (glutamine-hydrolysing)